MKMKTLIVALLLSVGYSATAVAQVDEKCLSNSTVSHEAVKAKLYKDAYLPWQEVMKDCPTLRYYTYTDGLKILTSFLKAEKRGSTEYNAHFDEMMGVYDQLMKYTPEFAKKLNCKSANRVLGDKAVAYLTYASSPDAVKAYGWLKTATDTEKEEAGAMTLFSFLQVSQMLVKANPDKYASQFFKDYQNSTKYCDAALADAKSPNIKKTYKTIKDNLIAIFINSGVADCESLQKIYGPKVEKNKADIDYLRSVIDIMGMMKCKDSEAYMQASYYAYKLEPTADAAKGCAFMYYKKKDYTNSIKFFDEAIELEADPIKKAETSYTVASVLSSIKKLSQAKRYCLEAIKYNNSYGAPYILLANLYATSPNWSDEPALNQCVYYVCVDKLRRAKAVDPSVADEAQKLINRYSSYFPKADKLFFLGLKKGDPVKIGGWIGETTTIR